MPRSNLAPLGVVVHISKSTSHKYFTVLSREFFFIPIIGFMIGEMRSELEHCYEPRSEIDEKFMY